MDVRQKMKLVAASLVFLPMVGCASLRVGSDYDREVSFEARETYDWVDAEEGEIEAVDQLNPFIDRRLRRAVNAELDMLGYRNQADGPVDLLLAVSVLDAEQGASPQTQFGLPFMLGLSLGYGPGFYWPGFGYSYGYGSRYNRFGRSSPFGFGSFGYYRPYFGVPYGSSAYGPYGYYGGGRRGNLEELVAGSFVIDVMDGETGDLIWRGWANGALSYAPDVEQLPGFIASVVHDMLEEFPPDRP